MYLNIYIHIDIDKYASLFHNNQHSHYTVITRVCRITPLITYHYLDNNHTHTHTHTHRYRATFPPPTRHQNAR